MDDPNTWKPDETPVHFISPLEHTLTISLRDDTNTVIAYEIPPMEVVTYPKYQADILKKKLVDAIINERNLGFITPEKMNDLYKEIAVDL